ncbi:ABC transporter ATP-binding protein [Jeotgalicoccus meleagridis]|uniref:Multidrug export ATP-binding/permease protein n=1 Tax=Jeotgalicoccus meleagridis TaxID=2759181 RepID=A0A6V7RLF7_9STAP|nr:ABC transporter ATP-binding protein [Jeotgalicoccus meleagridis]CAD2079017.1 Putative multidrug export ATP-binding/permease protein [Jeotgalicoccus meleagridis]
MKVVYSYAAKYKWLIVVALFFMFIELIIELIQPLFIQEVIDNGILSNDINHVILYLLIMTGVSIIAFLAGIFNTYFTSHLTNMFGYDLRMAIFTRIQHFTLSTFSKYSTSSLITRLTQDVLQTEMLLFMSLRILLRAPLLVIGSLFMSFMVNPTLGFYLSLLTPILVVFLFFTARKGAAIFLRVQHWLDRINRYIQQNLEAVRLIKANDRGQFETNKFAKIAGKLRDDTTFALRLMESILPVLLIIMNGSLLLVLWVASDLLSNNSVAVGEIVAVINYALRMQGGFSMFAFLIIATSRAKASSDRIKDVLESPIAKQDSPQYAESESEGYVSFKNVSFKYPNSSKYVLKNISFDIHDNENFVIMGGTGSGKSTLISLIPNMYDPTDGQVLVNGREVREWPTQDLRQTIGYVPQSAVLFTGSIYDNLLWGNLKAEEDEVMLSSEKAQIHDNIMSFDENYQTPVGQMGVTLSGGQKQRLSIARALVRKPAILILDDSTSALDVKTENNLWDALSSEKVTRIIITQKISTAMTADRVLLMDDGEVSAIGTHEELLETSSLYNEIYASQMTGGHLDD